MMWRDTEKEASRPARLEEALDALQEGVMLLDREYNITAANNWAQQRFALPPLLENNKCFAVLRGRHEPCRRCCLKRTSSSVKRSVRVFRLGRRGTCAQWFEENVYLLTDSKGATTGAALHIRDVTRQKSRELEMREEIRRRRILVEHSRDGIVVLDERGAVVEANPRFADMLGYSPPELRHLHVWDWEAEFSKEQLAEMIRAVDTRGDHFETIHRRKDGSLYYVEISTDGVMLRGKKYIFCVCRDITEKKAMQEQIRELAIRDPLTDVCNRRFVFERLSQLGAEYSRGGANFCICLLDLDHFKHINDLYGHQSGDQILREFAQLLTSSTRQCDLVGRYGGEEFIIVSTSAGHRETSSMIRRIMARLRQHVFFVRGDEVRLTLSCGLADSCELPRDRFSPETILEIADHRLYQAKGLGRDYCVGPPRTTQHTQTAKDLIDTAKRGTSDTDPG